MTWRDFKFELRMTLRRQPELWTLVAINVGVALVVWSAWAVMLLCGSSASPASWLSLTGDFSTFLTRPWTLLTYMVTHWSFLHLLFNMLWLWWFGEVLAESGSGRNVIVAYIAGGVAGAVCYLLAANMLPSLTATASQLSGASAAVVCVMTEAALTAPDRRFRLFLIGEIKLKWIAIVSLVLLFLGLGGGNAGGEAAHVGGALAGVALFAWKRRPRRAPRPRPASAPRRSAAKVTDVMSQYRNGMERLDQLLDKIKISGYDSLTSAERKELDRLSASIPRRKGPLKK